MDIIYGNGIKHDLMVYNIVYRDGNRILGEIDILGMDDDSEVLHVYEVKSRLTKHSFSKAQLQLDRSKNYLKLLHDHEIRIYLVILG